MKTIMSSRNSIFRFFILFVLVTFQGCTSLPLEENEIQNLAVALKNSLTQNKTSFISSYFPSEELCPENFVPFERSLENTVEDPKKPTPEEKKTWSKNKKEKIISSIKNIHFFGKRIGFNWEGSIDFEVHVLKKRTMYGAEYKLLASDNVIAPTQRIVLTMSNSNKAINVECCIEKDSYGEWKILNLDTPTLLSFKEEDEIRSLVSNLGVNPSIDAKLGQLIINKKVLAPWLQKQWQARTNRSYYQILIQKQLNKNQKDFIVFRESAGCPEIILEETGNNTKVFVGEKNLENLRKLENGGNSQNNTNNLLKALIEIEKSRKKIKVKIEGVKNIGAIPVFIVSCKRGGVISTDEYALSKSEGSKILLDSSRIFQLNASCGKNVIQVKYLDDFPVNFSITY